MLSVVICVEFSSPVKTRLLYCILLSIVPIKFHKFFFFLYNHSGRGCRCKYESIILSLCYRRHIYCYNNNIITEAKEQPETSMRQRAVNTILL